MSSTINSTDGSSVMADEAIYSTSRRMKELYAVIDKTLNEGERMGRQNLSRSFIKPLHRRVKKAEMECVSQLCSNMADAWRKSMQTPVNDVIAENDIKQKLYTLDELSAQEKARNPHKEAWRPTGVPKVDMKAYDDIRTLEYRDELTRHLQEMKKEVTPGKRDVERGRIELAEEQKTLSAMGKELKAALKKAKRKTDDNGKPRLTNEQLREMCNRFKEMTQNAQ